MRAVEKGVKKIAEYSKMDAVTLLKYFNQEYMARPLEEKEIQDTILKSKDKEYKYLCKRPLIKKHCDASACVRHLCGITPEQAADLIKAEQAVGDITEYTSKPPIFYESVDVKKRVGDGYIRINVPMQGSDIIDKQKWINILANAGNFPHPAILKMKPGEFHAFQYARLDKRVYEEADEEASDDNEFKIMVYSFIRKSTVSFDDGVLLEGGCYVNQKTHDLEFRLNRLVEYFRSQRDNTSVKKICFNLKHIMKAKKKNGKIYNSISKKEVSCPTWHFISDPGQYSVLGDVAKKIEHDKN
jgi:hypothetical protein